MGEITLRNNCVICGSDNIEQIMCIKSMPVYMGVVEEISEYIYEDMTFSKCHNCYEIQLNRLMDPEVVYSHNHNIEIVGELWRKHYVEFMEFMGNIHNKTILEIGDPSAKIAKISKSYSKWIIVEKNPHLKSTDKIEFREEFFDDDFIIDEEVNVIVHSHLLEHIYEPVNFFKKCRDILVDDGYMFFSIPNMNFSIENKFSPNAILQFEHTYYIDEYYLQKICDRTGFEIVKKTYFNGHSVFYQLKKSEIKKTEYVTNDVSDKFINLYKLHTSKIEKINEIIKDRENVFLYGSHITSQFYIFNGLDISKVIGLLDGSKSKIGRYLYGTNLKTFSLDEISKYKDVIVITSHMGIYTSEISDALVKINNNVTII